MDTPQTPRFSIPLLAAGQAHKELFHNEALVRLDFLSHPAVIAVENDPSILTPQEGESWLVGTSPSGDWSQYANHIAGWSGGGWRLIAPVEAMQLFISSAQVKARFSQGNWSINGIISPPGGGSTIDSEARTAIDSILAALETAGILPPAP